MIWAFFVTMAVTAVFKISGNRVEGLALSKLMGISVFFMRRFLSIGKGLKSKTELSSDGFVLSLLS